MSGVGRWSLGIGVGLLAVAVLCAVLNLVPVAAIAGILGLVALGIAGYDAVYYWLDRADRRRREASARREREARERR
ncbi:MULTISPECIES: hypothetical protein [unclassified Parafrankia]|uniref:hypothetical protein n=1 Tax=unclassified Parafrankia TaxID=2994368 RepID=UPI000DA46943|nr:MULTISPECIES: hypothetical protein [unclassified Parafrankia]TCJ32201.1 hypothetical protein E0504_44225 [Parafrankia sp. BMG5.11]SQE00430.1 conserved hypothetical protein [Parafrankia sp. Ea1.12]